jgi:hypothetical protein
MKDLCSTIRGCGSRWPSASLIFLPAAEAMVDIEPRAGVLELRSRSVSRPLVRLDDAPDRRADLHEVHRRGRVGAHHPGRGHPGGAAQPGCHHRAAGDHEACDGPRAPRTSRWRPPRWSIRGFWCRPCSRRTTPTASTAQGRQSSAALPETPMPVFWDFAYFSFTIAAACQTADVSTLDPRAQMGVGAHADLLSVQRIDPGLCHQCDRGSHRRKLTDSRLIGGALDDLAALHDEGHGLQARDIRERISRDGNQIAVTPDGDGADIGGAARVPRRRWRWRPGWPASASFPT